MPNDLHGNSESVGSTLDGPGGSPGFNCCINGDRVSARSSSAVKPSDVPPDRGLTDLPFAGQLLHSCPAAELLFPAIDGGQRGTWATSLDCHDVRVLGIPLISQWIGGRRRYSWSLIQSYPLGPSPGLFAVGAGDNRFRLVQIIARNGDYLVQMFLGSPSLGSCRPHFRPPLQKGWLSEGSLCAPRQGPATSRATALSASFRDRAPARNTRRRRRMGSFSSGKRYSSSDQRMSSPIAGLEHGNRAETVRSLLIINN